MYSNIRLRPNKNLWILEDDPSARMIYEEMLEMRYHLRFFESLESFRNGLNSVPLPHLCIADLRLSDGNFLNFLQEQPKNLSFRIPFLVVSVLDDLDILRACFKDGALDYLSKPFRKNELIVKIERFMETPSASRKIPTLDLVLDPESLQVKIGNHDGVQLTAKELQIFSLLSQAAGQPLSRQEVKLKVWGDINVSPKTFDVHLFHLRRKLRNLGIEIKFSPLDGYFLTKTTLEN